MGGRSGWMLGLVVVLCMISGAGRAVAAPAAPAALGILVPVGPPDYRMIFDRLTDDSVQQFGPFTFHAGKIGGVPVVINIAPADGPLMRSLAAQEMLHHFTIGAFLYPGTSGAHLGPDTMRIGDIILGAANVDFGNFFLSKNGDVTGDEFGHERFAGKTHYGPLYLDPALLARLACAADRVAGSTRLPGWLNPQHPRDRPDIFFYGIQGTSTMWLADRDFMQRIDRVFHVMDEDGDWYSNLVATLYRVPFIEVSTIADSVPELPDTERGIPVAPAGAPKAPVVAQRISDAIMLDLIAHDGNAILAARFDTPTRSPYPASAFADPKRDDGLLRRGGCR
ncbi:hypothetical protein [Rhizosaccharibacter radicis]|uniref:Nucleoside phosphorylase domain-containing protein n=1 Tax=Rhizosaccharibacter radicis TaxID=2782605 RepID=A0ABT1W1P1_9PROT|nr:hypothetical protein [Acetobacteraceae bacterium KSS12]